MLVICSSIMVLKIDISIQYTKAVSKVVMIYNNVIYGLLNAAIKGPLLLIY